MSPSTKILKSEQSPTGHPVSDEEIVWIGSILSLAAVVGVPLYSYLADAYGRKFAVISLAVPQLVSSSYL
jgi:MFS family permease